MKKHFYAFMLLALVGVSAVALGACEGGSTQEEGYSITITNKAQLQESWPIGEPNRSLSIELDPVSNATSEVATGNLVVTSSNTDVVVATGLSLTAVGLGEATITATWHGASDSVDVVVIANTYDYSIADVNAGLRAGTINDGDTISFYGQVVASMEPSTTHMYSGIYLGDGDESLMLYSGQVDNYFFAEDGSLAINYGDNIGVSATVSAYNGFYEFKPTYIEPLDSSITVTTPTPKEMSETDWNSLTYTDVGRLAKMELTYVSGTVSTEASTHSTIKAKVGDTDVNYYVNYHNGTDEIAALASKINTLDEGDTFTSYGVIGWYNGPELCPNFMLVDGEVITPSECVTVPEKIAPTELKITGSNSVTIRSTTTLEVAVNEGASRLVNWTSSDESVATVSDGVVFGAGIGTANITATSTLDSSISDTIAISVGYITAPEKYNSETNYYLGFDLTEVSDEGIYLFNGTLSGNYGATTQKEEEAAVITYTPVKDTDQGGCIGFQLTFTDSTGNTQYIAMNDSHYFTFTSEPYTLGYSEEYDTFTALDGTSEYYFGTYASNGSYYKTISCSRISYAATSVTSTLFTSDDLPGPVAPTSVTVSAPTTTIYPGETIQLSVTVDEGADDSVTYSLVSGQEYVSVTEDGQVTGLNNASAGEAVIRATAKTAPDNGQAASGEITITLGAPEYSTSETITASELGYNNADDVDDIYGTCVKITFDQANGNNHPKYYNDGTNIRVYAKNTITFASRYSSYGITKIELNCTSNYLGNETMTATNATIDRNSETNVITLTATDSSTAVVLTNEHTANSGGTQLRITSIVITYTSLAVG